MDISLDECDRILHSIQSKKPTKIIVTVESAFAEFDDGVNYNKAPRHDSGVIREGMGGCIERL